MLKPSGLAKNLESFVYHLAGEVDEKLPGHHVVCAIVKPTGKVGCYSTFTKTANAVKVLRDLADRLEREETHGAQ